MPHARRAGAINTIIFQDDGTLTGDNTDGMGLCRDLINNHQIELKGKRLLLLGAGGAARGVIEPFASVSAIIIVYRQPYRPAKPLTYARSLQILVMYKVAAMMPYLAHLMSSSMPQQPALTVKSRHYQIGFSAQMAFVTT